MADESKLVISVDSRSVPQATAQLDAMTAAAGRTEAAAKSLGETESEAQARIRAMVRSSLAAAEADRARAAALRSSGASLRAAADSNSAFAKSSAELAAAQTAAMSATTRMLAASEAQSVAIKRSSADQLLLDTVMKGSLKTNGAMEAAETRLHQAYERGALSAAELTAALKVLDKQREKDALLATLQGKAENTRGVNARVGVEGVRVLGDLATGNTRRAQMSGLAAANYSGLTGRIVAGIATPIGAAATAGVAALALLTAAYVAGQKETAAYNKALALTGSTGVTTAGQLRDVATALGDATGKYGDARAVVLALVQAGEAASPMFERAAKAAMDYANATGVSAADATKTVTGIMSGSFSAIDKVDKAYNFLTASQREHVRELDNEGRATDAAAFALQAFADKSKEASDKAVADAGWIEKAWHGVTSAIGDAANAFKRIGAAQSIGDQLKSVNTRLANATAGVDPSHVKQIQSLGWYKDLQALQKSLQSQLVAQGFEQTQAAINANAEKNAKTAMEALSKFKTPMEAFSEQRDKLQHDRMVALLAPSLTAADKAKIESRFAVGIQQAADALNRALAKDQPKDRPDRKSDPLASMTSMIEGMKQSAQRAEGPMGEFIATTMKLTTARDEAIKKGADAGAAEKLFAEGIAIANQRLKEQEQQLQERTKVAMQQFTAALQQQMDVQRQQNDLSIASIGMGAQQAQREQQLLQIRQATAQQIFQMQQRAQSDVVNAHGDQAEIKRIHDTLAKQQAEYQAYGDWQIAEAKRAFAGQDAARADWANGFHATYQDLLAQSKDFASVASQEMLDFANTTTNALVGLAKGTMSLKDAFDSVIDAMLTDALRFLANQAVVKFLGMFNTTGQGGGGFGIGNAASLFGGSGGSGGGIDWGSLATDVASWFSANGNVFGPGGPIRYANGGIVGSPTLLRFAGGIGLVGEAGPEAIMPLKRGRDGKLGVSAPAVTQTAGGARSTTINVNVQPTSTRQTATQIAQEVARKQQLATARG